MKKNLLSLNQYQSEAGKTDLTGADPQDGIMVSVLGILGEAGDLATLFKKKLRDGDSFTVYPEQCAEELGDILWYLANVCTKLGFSLEDVAKSNLAKTKLRWEKFQKEPARRPFFDEGFPKGEQLPRKFSVRFTEELVKKRTVVTLFYNEKVCGDRLTDNSYFEDGYRYHDVFHLAYATVLGWSPVTRKILGCKRRSDERVDEIEDGGRAAVTEEAISALMFEYASKHNLLDGVGRIDSDLLSLITRSVSGFEAKVISAGEWEQAILLGYKMFRLLNRHKGGTVTADLNARTLVYQKIAKIGAR